MKAKTKTPRAVPGAFSDRKNKKAEKFRNLSAVELNHRERELADQLFRLKFQMAMGQTESLQKVRALRRDLARVKSIRRGRELGTEPAGTESK